ncbi:thiol:disulfide interchange protein DsbA [[Enterobacter] lignolyticus]|uniref:Thiol:disulfide interchange protein n=1 Tax=[Enterobacter] lignolyticus TaxID=1334193 RepID=A0A806XDI0_9ENTR|nr:thiol:disulfide interchange protein DsbA [[Enterobacter] lignolyticus]ALR77833.1 protein disulfide isomerase [[Enterobacter] lignolyticus]
MKKYLLPFVALLLSFGAQAASYSDGKEFVSLKKTVQDAPPVLEFFSFYCPSCYQYDEVMKVADSVKKKLPSGVTLTQYHASFMGPLGEDLTHAWSVAKLLQVEDKVKPLMFEAVQKNRSVNTVDDIRAVFEKAGVNASDFDAAWNSFAVKSLTAKQNAMAQAVELSGVPAMFVKGQYQVNPKGLNTQDVSAFVTHFAETVDYLLNAR